MKISEITRRAIVDYCIISKEQVYGRIGLIDFLKRTWDLQNMPSTDSRFKNAEADIWQHNINNNDWEHTYLFYDYLNLLRCDDEIFCKFVENCVHPVLTEKEKVIDERVQEFNKYLEKDGFRLEQTSNISGRAVYAIKNLNQGEKIEEKYEVVLSFAGKDRPYVEETAKFLSENGVKIFYDKYEEVTLWGKELTEHLDRVYRGNARYCIIFISKYYKDQVWPTHEKRSALVKALNEKEEYILPARFDDTEILGLRPTIGYITLKDKTPKQFGLLILKKLGRA